MRSLLQGANGDVQVKICGLRTPEHMRAAVDAGTDMLGFMFYEPSSRYIRPQQAQAFLESLENDDTVGADESLPPAQFIAPDMVGVFVNEDAAYINEVAQQVGLHTVQLHGDETPEFCHTITRPVIKALRLHDMSDMVKVRAYRDVAWRILLDTPAHGWGGSGITHDWTIARSVARVTRVLLAGGLTPENVVGAIRQVRPWGVDVSSGVETNGLKDTSKIRAFIGHVRAIGASLERERETRL
jgi:phosphoribosylanthranilate isomerase